MLIFVIRDNEINSVRSLSTLKNNDLLSKSNDLTINIWRPGAGVLSGLESLCAYWLRNILYEMLLYAFYKKICALF